MKNPMEVTKPICGAHSRTTGEPCKKPPLANGRCRLHGGLSTGRPITHGMTTRKAKADRAKLRELVKSIKELL